MDKRPAVGLLFGLVLQGSLLFGADLELRYGIKPDLKNFPQSKPKEALTSILKAVKEKKHSYLLAHLADPEWVKRRVKSYGGKFGEVVEETRDQLSPLAIKRLESFLEKGTWKTTDKETVVTYDKIPSRVIRLRQVDGRWVLLNDFTPKS